MYTFRYEIIFPLLRSKRKNLPFHCLVWSPYVSSMIMFGSCFRSHSRIHGWMRDIPNMRSWAKLSPHPRLLMFGSCFMYPRVHGWMKDIANMQTWAKFLPHPRLLMFGSCFMYCRVHGWMRNICNMWSWT